MSKETEHTSTNRRSVAKRVLSVLDGSFLTREAMLNNISYLLFLFVIGISYIANSQYAEGTVIAMERLNREIKDLRSEFISTKSELMFVSKQSKVAQSVAEMGIYESRVPPKKIVITKKEKPED